MNLPESAGPAVLDARQQILRRKMNDHLDQVLRLRPLSAQTRYAHMIASDRDWMIAEQPVRELPYALGQLISLDVRDQGNALIEETRHLNNRFADRSYRDIEAILSGAPECLDLQARILEWGEEVAAQVVYKLRNRARQDPVKTFDSAYRSIVRDLDTRIVHGSDRMYMLVWSAVVDMLPYKLLDALLLQPGHIEIHLDARSGHASTIDPRWVRHDGFKGEGQFARCRLGTDTHGCALRSFVPGILIREVTLQVFGHLVRIDEVGWKRINAPDGCQARFFDLIN